MPTTFSIAIATCAEWPLPSLGLLKVIHTLEAAGHSVKVMPWQQEQQIFADADLILPLCAWDYAKHPEQFRDWLVQTSISGGAFGNCPSLMAWNMDKSYLLDLENSGVNVPKTIKIDKGEQIETAMAQRGWDCAVIKPAIGQSGHGVQMLNHSDQRKMDIKKTHILQAWIPEIKQGELSMIFLNGQYSHAVTRMPAQEDWRANSQYGVTVSGAKAPEAAITAAQACLSDLSQMPLYVRVDGLIMPDGKFLLTELELIEPALFFDIVPASAKNLADAICTFLDMH